ncbi:MAG: nodulation protein NfeD [Bacteroidales bacterium]|nr:nodulation protein NfeD [Bacteroidales bacterium]MCF8390175.1 nodulation protein NfeD [Bacteroidales bacterium]
MKIITKNSFYTLLITLGVFFFSSAQVSNPPSKQLVYKYDIKEQIAKPVWRTTQKAFSEANEKGADIIIIHMNTYGGLVDMADSIRTKILNSEIPVYVFIDDNAASAGALISIACDSIYMKPGGKIGAATVVNQTGEQVPDKYQSYMRATMRATAEAQGKDTIITGNDTTITWKRNPAIAEAMVDPSMYVPEVSDTGKVLTFTATEALKYNFADGIVKNIPDLLKHAGINEYELIEYSPTFIDIIIGLLLSPILQSLLIMGIVGGLYFELQSPGIGFPLAISVLAATLYFAPLYLEGLADNWEMLVFVLGVILVAVEIFAIPGFGVAGATGLILIIGGLVLAMVDNLVFDSGDISLILNVLLKATGLVIVSLFLSLIISLYLGKKLFTSPLFPHLALDTTQKTSEGFIGVEGQNALLVGKEGIAHTVLRPSGLVDIDGETYDAVANIGFIDKGSKVIVKSFETGQIHVEKI